MLYSRFDRAIRKLVPSVGKISYNPVTRTVGNVIASALSLPFAELRQLPPNHLRIRIGVGNRILANHVHFLEMGNGTWLDFLSKQYCTASSDVVELGCGCGRIAHPLRGEWFTGTYVGVDLDREMIDYCRNHFPKEKFSFVLSPHKSATYSPEGAEGQERGEGKLVIADAASKDFIFSISLYSHLLEPEMREYLQESARILRPGAIMHLTFFCMEHVELGVRWTFGHPMGNSFVENLRLPEAAVAYKEDYIRGVVREMGFRDISISPRKVQSILIARKE
jgi:SAM-dependent methyltransferase